MRSCLGGWGGENLGRKANDKVKLFLVPNIITLNFLVHVGTPMSYCPPPKAAEGIFELNSTHPGTTSSRLDPTPDKSAISLHLSDYLHSSPSCSFQAVQVGSTDRFPSSATCLAPSGTARAGAQ